MTYTPHLTRKLYKTTLSMDDIKHPNELPSPEGAGKDQDWCKPVVWHMDDGSVYVTFWDDYLTAYNKDNGDKFTIASSSDATKVRALYDETVRTEYNHMVTTKYTSAELAVPTDDMKTDMTAMMKDITDVYDAMVIIK